MVERLSHISQALSEEPLLGHVRGPFRHFPTKEELLRATAWLGSREVAGRYMPAW
jgi:hypothetical protein